MVEITDYERRGDLDAPFELTKVAEGSEAERADPRCGPVRRPDADVGAVRRRGAVSRLWRPYRDAEHWESKGTMHFTDEERARYDVEQDRYKSDHPECSSRRHSVAGSLTTHCGKCCPPPLMSPSQRDEIARLLGPTPPRELMRWRLRLYCGHVVERTAHYTHKTLHAALMSARACPECGLDPATIVDGEAIGLKTEPPSAARPAARATTTKRSGKPTKVELEARVRELEAEVERLREG